MALPQNKIGDFEFCTLRGQWQYRPTMLDMVNRAGVNDTLFRDTGQRGEPFPVQSMVDCATWEGAWTTLEAYQDLIGDDAVAVIVNDLNLQTALGLLHKVVRVEFARTPQRCSSFVGGLNAPSAAVLVCQWLLVAVPAPEPEPE